MNNINHFSPSKKIFDKLESKEKDATPFSCIPWFIKEFAIKKSWEENLFTILSYVWNKEVAHLDKKLSQTQNKNMMDFWLYRSIQQIEKEKKEQLIWMWRSHWTYTRGTHTYWKRTTSKDYYECNYHVSMTQGVWYTQTW